MINYPCAVYSEGSTQLYSKGRGGKGASCIMNVGTLSRCFGLRSSRPEISACEVFVGRRFRPVSKSPMISEPITPQFPDDSAGPWGCGRGVNVSDVRRGQNVNKV